ncbi:MAG: D-tyrosyl-tRNA(Tyr) deacylase [Sulfitobacter litoralis]|jgi:D-tyrosyl-tRNA(Tyr) deacylase|uniref:D-aminoacyl-tRNA deacylase n=1 Tax=Sulfitobacter TaxID=60136 RepID=UPI001B5F9821|nr:MULTISPECIES: D-aminoacyl-tRNA deacylase [Sulfitobacter]MBQ0766387.1 D-tyrosyl-tRNA(Tyr) deacylase [Sulfitobacter litoralis]MBQ0803025.1 D-tyrosyl-tRNA(Tyr) deacylase [Sulfitobacter litoralis]MCF7726522.1 D-tyrosyl-tRNA(Tyr) deacylase [Sulfitobacter sp. M22]MCF7777864.1 D-tyrosyl-tRNA(Tyr) deacylase [Sulfitobacter sp. M220]|tara:strand:+ start:26 stop:472 length:447 start_codon:yes stop_codon:yes gene_type:complete
MRALLQRATDASVTVDGQIIGQIEHGLLIFVCAMPDDTQATAQTLAQKIAKLRLFKDEAGKMNRSLADTGGSALIVSQFTLAADTSRGTRPGFSRAAKPDQAKMLYQDFIVCIEALGIPVQTGAFGADMSVALTNDGPVTLWLDTENP